MLLHSQMYHITEQCHLYNVITTKKHANKRSQNIKQFGNVFKMWEGRENALVIIYRPKYVYRSYLTLHNVSGICGVVYTCG